MQSNVPESRDVIHDAPLRYRAYLLRCWEMRSPGPGDLATWRFSLEEPSTGEKHGFTDLEAMHDFLQAQLAETDSASSR
jgi:hypothetical protein